MIKTHEPEFQQRIVEFPVNSIAVECRGFVYRDEDGRFCAFATRLPGVYGEGDTADEAFSDLCEAFQYVLETYLEEEKPIPWRDRLVRSDLTGTEYWAVVYVKKTAVG